MVHDNPRKNSEGYSDSTAYEGLKPIIQEEHEVQNKVNKLIACLKIIVDLAGFDLIARIQVKHRKSGKEFK